MSENSTPPDETLKNWMKNAESVIQLIAENLRYGTWFKRILLIDAVVLFGLNPGIAGQIASIFLGIKELPDWYARYFWGIVGLIFAIALVIGIATTPRPKALTPEDTKERKAIKGLRPFTAADAEIFAKLQRKKDVQECLEALTSNDFRFGVLMSESGCGKTSFLQAGMMPRLTTPEATHQGVYIRFSDRNPFDTVLAEVATLNHAKGAQQLSLGNSGTDLLPLLTQAAEMVGKPLILFFDQFEQFFVHQKRKEDREPFIQALQQWYDSKVPAKILVSIRGDMSDRLVELQYRLGYSLGPQEVFRLERFSPEEATNILNVIADTEQLQFDQQFVKNLTETELASREDGTISPVDLQILSWMIEHQDTTEERAFNRVAFQKFGGVEGLLTRFLERTLDARVIKLQREAAVKVLLALTDLERNVRSGVLTISDLQAKLQGSLTAPEVTEATLWLARSDVRLLSPVEQGEQTGYELAHERLIPAVRTVAGKELTAAQKANELLERRVNEWLGNQCHPRYLFNIAELQFLHRQKPYLVWGDNRPWKERLIHQSQRRLYGWVGAFAAVGLAVLGFFGWRNSPPGQLQQIRWLLADLSKDVRDDEAVPAVVAIAKDGSWQDATQILLSEMQNSRVYVVGGYKPRVQIINQLSQIVILQYPKNSDESRKRLAQLEKIATEMDKTSQSLSQGILANAHIGMKDEMQARKLLSKALANARLSADRLEKVSALSLISIVLSKLNEDQQANQILTEALTTTRILETYEKAFALERIAEAAGNLKNGSFCRKVLTDVLKIARPAINEVQEFDFLARIIEASDKLEDLNQPQPILAEVFAITRIIKTESQKVSALNTITNAASKLKDTNQVKFILDESLAVTSSIKDDFARNRVVQDIVTAASNFKDGNLAKSILDKALASTRNLRDESERIWSLRTIATALANLKDTDQAKYILNEALSIAQNIKDESSKAWSLRTIASAFSKLKDTNQANSLLSEALAIARQNKDEATKARFLSEIADVYLEIKQTEPTRQTLDEAFQSAKKVKDSWQLKDIAISYGKLGEWGRALAATQDCTASDQLAALGI